MIWMELPGRVWNIHDLFQGAVDINSRGSSEKSCRKGWYMNEKVAVRSLKQGDLNGLEALVKSHQVKAVRAAFLIVNDRALAEEVVQKAFIKSARRIDQFDERYPFGPWFYRIVVNDALKVVRRQKRFVSLDRQLEDQTAQLAEWLMDPKPGPEKILEIQEQRQDIVQAIHSLPPDRRAAVVMFYYLEMSMKEMSRKVNRPLSTIKWWLRDARKRLRILLQESVIG